MMQLARKTKRDILDSLTIEDALLDGAKIKLFANDIALSPQMLLGDFEEPTFTGYALKSATWSASYIDADDVALINSNLCEFICTASGDTNTVYGYYVVSDDVSPVLLGAELFETPVQITQSGDAVVFYAKVGY